MPFCVAINCKNQYFNNPNASYHQFPREVKRKEAWFVATGRSTLPKSGRLCSEHFEESCYERSSNLKLDLCPDLFTGRGQTKRKLKSNAIPTIFPHKEAPIDRVTSTARFERIEHAEVSANLVFHHKSQPPPQGFFSLQSVYR